MSMKKLLLAVFACLSINFLVSCAAQQEEPQASGMDRADTNTWQQATETETMGVPTPRQHPDPEREYFVLPSDSSRITHEGTTTWLMIRGPLANGCQRHEFYDTLSNGPTLYLTIWGSRPTDSTVVCTEQVQGYDREIKFENSHFTRFSIIQPDGRTKTYALQSAQISAK
jgi:hypothetical protein